ncbi:MAG: M24 family metallopeptidase [Candidatus Bathyarchaeota archaeon]|nr:M24 family metallopeptidase [Candidatus Bathyarchaeota archaeon]
MADVLRPSGEGYADAYRGKILPLRLKAEVRNRWLKQRLETVLPEIMRREGLDMWIVVAREYNEDPVIMTLLPEPMMYARRRTIVVFYLKDDGTLERLVLSRYGIKNFYEGVWDPDEEEQYDCLGRVVKERDPKAIGINVSETFAFGDGLTHSEHGLLSAALGEEYMGRTRHSERLAVGWLERRIKPEMEAYPGIVEITHAIVAEAFSSRVINPGITTTDDVVWWMRQKMLDLSLQAWFQPSVDIQAPGQKYDAEDKRKLIRPGDLLHCDIGFYYLGLATDIQQNAYVLKAGESEAPEGLKAALSDANRLQEIHAEEMVAGRTGNQILKAALDRAKREGINASIYTHPLGYHGHAAGPTIGLWDRQEGVPGRGDYELFEDTCFAIELNVKREVPEWGGQEVRMALEQDAVFTGGKLHFMAGRQTRLHLIG